MDASNPAVPLETLLAHRAWVRTLALALTRDEHAADDVEQQTWLAALVSPPATDESPRGWLGTVARNAARKRTRSAMRQRARERSTARPESVPGSDPAELAARAELHTKVASAVVELAEPYRQALLLRYFEGLAVAAVATRMGAPLETTRARLRRGREQLRGRLDRDVARGRPLAVALLPLLDADRALVSGGAAVAAAGGLAMATKVVGGVVAGLLLVAGIWWGAQGPNPPPGDGGAETSAALEEDPLVVAPAPEVEPAPPKRARVRAPQPTEDADTPFVEDLPAEQVPERKSVEELMGASIESVSFAGEQLTLVLAEVSDVTGIPIHVDARRAKGIENIPIHMQMEGVPAGMMLTTMARMCGMKMAVEEDRVVLYGAGDTWTADLATIVIEPKSRDPNAPQTIAVSGSVVDVTGAAVEGAEIRHGSTLVGTSDAAGEFGFDALRPFSFVTARKLGSQDSNVVRVHGEPGDSLEAALIIGPPSGTAIVRVTSSSGTAPKMTQMRFRWVDPIETRVGRDGVERPVQGSTSGVSMEGETQTFTWLPPGELELTVWARGHVRDQRVVTVEEGSEVSVAVELRRIDVSERLRDERVSFDVTDEPARRVLEIIRLQKALDVTFAAGMPAEVFDAPISLCVSNDSIESALRTVCSALPGSVTWKIQGDVVVLYQQ